MKFTIDADAILARILARRSREASLRSRGVTILREWRDRIDLRARLGRASVPPPAAEPARGHEERDH